MKVSFVLGRLYPYMGKKKHLYSVALLLSGLSALLSLLPFVFIWLIIKQLLEFGALASGVAVYAWATIGSAFLAMLVYFGALLLSHLVAFEVEVAIRRRGMAEVMAMPLGFFNLNSSGKIRKIIDDNAAQTHNFIAHQMPDFIAGICAPLLLLLLLLLVDYRLGLACLLPIALGFFVMGGMSMGKKAHNMRQQYMQHLEQMSAEAVEYVRGIVVVKTFGQSVHAFKKFLHSIHAYRDMVYAVTLGMKTPFTFYTAIMQSTAFFLLPLAVLFINNRQPVLMVLSDFIFYLLIAPTFSLLLMRIMYLQNHSSISAHIIDSYNALLSYPKMDFVSDKTDLDDFSIHFEQVNFSYANYATAAQNAKNALNNISFSVAQGQSVAIVGASGSGKTTIARLVARFWDADSGQIKIGKLPIANISQAQLMQNIAFVMQDNSLFNASLRDNICYGSENASEEQLAAAIKNASCESIIKRLPQGLATIIGKGGTYLSGGEEQRIALARAFLKDAPIIILDEATAYADPENEYLIHLALQKLRRNKTCIFIAHRLHTIKDAAQILVLEQGTIIERGNHRQLLAAEGAYFQMWNDYQQSLNWHLKN